MTSDALMQLLAAARSGSISYALVKACSESAAITDIDLLNILALYVAEQYDLGAMPYEDADKIMNAAWGVSTTAAFWEANDSTIPDRMYQVYLAFDEGEYQHRGDAEDIDPVLTYTNPLVKAFLQEVRNDAQPSVPADGPASPSGRQARG